MASSRVNYTFSYGRATVSQDSFPERVTGIFRVTQSFSPHLVTLVFTQPLTEMSTKGFTWGQGRPVRKADNFTTFICRLSENPGSFNLLEPSDPTYACIVMALPLLFITNVTCYKIKYFYPLSWFVFLI